MKPSEWIEQNKLIKGKQPSSIWSDLKELDKRFKDVEELKEKVIFLFRQLLNDRVVDDNNFYESNKIKIKVLELLEE